MEVKSLKEMLFAGETNYKVTQHGRKKKKRKKAASPRSAARKNKLLFVWETSAEGNMVSRRADNGDQVTLVG